MAVIVNVHDAKTHLSALLAKVETGEDVVISRAGQPVARLVPMKEPRQLGTGKGKFWMSDDFDAPLPADVLDEFEK